MEEQNENCELYLEKELLSPYTYYAQVVNEKRFNFKYFLAFNHWLQIPKDKLTSVRDICRMLYTSSILCDDIQDHTQVRGVFPALHCIYGAPLTINASFHLLLLLLKKASNLCPEASNVVVEEYLELTRGQGIEIYWRDNYICPTEDQYRKMIKKKTGSFFKGIYRLLQLFSENKTDYSKLASTLGSYFQILDDYYDLKQKEGLEGWPEEEDKRVYYDLKFCEDITEGKFSLPVIHAMKTEYGEQIMNILRQRTRDLNLKKYFVSLLEKAGSLQYTRNVLAEFDRELRAETARFGGNPIMDALLDQHLNWQ